MMPQLGRTLIFAGIGLALLGVIILFGDRLPIRLGQLPGDIAWKGKQGAIYIPLTTCLLLSIVGSLLLWVIGKVWR